MNSRAIGFLLVIALGCDSGHSSPNQEYHNFNRSTFSYRYDFGDEWIAAESGEFKVNNDIVNVFSEGHWKFQVRQKVYEFKYKVAADGVRGTLFYISSSGSKIEEKFDEPFMTSVSKRISGTIRSFDILRNNIEDEDQFSRAIIYVRFPFNENHVAFSCVLNVEADKAPFSLFMCETYENRTDYVVNSTPNIPDPGWVAEQKLMKIKALSALNHHDGYGNYEISYAFDTKVDLKEVGRSVKNSSEALIAGFVTLNDGHDVIHFNYFHTTSDKLYDAVVLTKEGKNRFQMHASGNHTFKTPSDSNVPYPATLVIQREMFYVEEQPFVRVNIELSFSTGDAAYPYIHSVKCQINEKHSYCEQTRRPLFLPPIRPAYIPSYLDQHVFLSLVG